MNDIVDANVLTRKHDLANLEIIDNARLSGRIDDSTAKYLIAQYSDGMDRFRDVFHVLGKCLGAPKNAVMAYDVKTNSVINEKIKISDINPLSAYLVNHRLDVDPMRNQFFTSDSEQHIELSVSSIVTVIVGAQKRVDRAIDKITGKYYSAYIDEVLNSIRSIVSKYQNDAFVNDICEKIKKVFNEKYVSDISVFILQYFGTNQGCIAVELLRELDKIRKPYERLWDVWRVKCLFDLIPQARTFIERLQEIMPDKVLAVRDRFYDMNNPRNYRDSKIIINIGNSNQIIPMEIICQVRTFFDFERKTHEYYEQIRKQDATDISVIENSLAEYLENGVNKYNLLIVNCLDDLFDRIGWNILYSRGGDVSMFEGFPPQCSLYYPEQIFDKIMDKLDLAVQNEIFRIENSPVKLTTQQQCNIFRFMASFILISAFPYAKRGWTVPNTGLSGALFNFVMKEVQRYYKA